MTKPFRWGCFERYCHHLRYFSFHLINQNTSVSIQMILVSVYYYEVQFTGSPSNYRGKNQEETCMD